MLFFSDITRIIEWYQSAIWTVQGPLPQWVSLRLRALNLRADRRVVAYRAQLQKVSNHPAEEAPQEAAFT